MLIQRARSHHRLVLTQRSSATSASRPSRWLSTPSGSTSSASSSSCSPAPSVGWSSTLATGTATPSAPESCPRATSCSPLFVMDTLGQWYGLPGLFVAGIFSGALSTVSSGMNSLAAIVLEDYVKAGCCPDISEKKATLLSKVLSLFFGLLTFGLVFVAEQLGNILSAALSIFGMVGGPLLGVFTLGMFFPWANSKGAFTGLLTSLIFMFWIGGGHQVARWNGQITFDRKVTSIEGCNLNETSAFSPLTAAPLVAEEPAKRPPLPSPPISYIGSSHTGPRSQDLQECKDSLTQDSLSSIFWVQEVHPRHRRTSERLCSVHGAEK
nr:sodium-dependent multivitamin transporter-like [Penaeus vannamei]